jgi:hypothetical protein
VIDNSHSMEPRQAELAATFPQLIDALRSYALGSDGSGKPCSVGDKSGCNIPDLRIGVVTTDLGAGNWGHPSCAVTGGDDGKLQNTPRVSACSPPMDPWIAYDQKTMSSNVLTGASNHIDRVKAAFGCIAPVGIAGCGFEQTLAAARRALDPALEVNKGFLRGDAVLAVVFITDEDDCSGGGEIFDPSQQGLGDLLGPLNSFRCFEFGVTCEVNGRAPGPRTDCKPKSKLAAAPSLYPVEDYVDFFRALKPPGHVVFGAIVGPTSPVVVGLVGKNPTVEPSCATSHGTAAPAIRIQALLDNFWHVTGSACDEQAYRKTLEQLGAALAPDA